MPRDKSLPGDADKPRWVCQSCGYVDLVLPMPKDREKYYAKPKPGLCPNCKTRDMSPHGF